MKTATPEPEIVITLDGSQVTVEVTGVQGPACRALSQPYTEMFHTEEVKKKPEFHKLPTAQRKGIAR
jgi:hypothetical protein